MKQMLAYRTTDNDIIALANTLKPSESAEVIFSTQAEAKKFYLRYQRSIIRNSLSSILSISRSREILYIALKSTTNHNPITVIKEIL